MGEVFKRVVEKKVAQKWHKMPVKKKTTSSALTIDAIFSYSYLGTEGEIRTLKGLPPVDFESTAFTIPPPRLGFPCCRSRLWPCQGAIQKGWCPVLKFLT